MDENIISNASYIVGSSPDRVKPMTIKLVFVASPLNTLHKREGAETGWLGIRVMCLNGGRNVYPRTVVSVS